jgi:hypothetical protein
LLWAERYRLNRASYLPDHVAQFEAVTSSIVRVIVLALILDYRGRLERNASPHPIDTG